MTKTIMAIIGGVLFITALAVGGWQLGWWLNNSAANHQANITFNGLGAQSADIAAARSGISQLSSITTQIEDPTTPKSEVASLVAQRAAITTQTCASAQNITATVPNDIQTFIADDCN